MKKVIVSAFSLGLALTATTSFAAINTAHTVISVSLKDDAKKTAVKSEELPETIKKTLAGDDYKGWTLSEAFLVTEGESSRYEISLNNAAKETKTIKFDKDGNLLK